MHILNINLWQSVFIALIYKQPIPAAYHQAIAPIVHQFAVHGFLFWFMLGLFIMAGKLVMIKLGKGFLKGITKLPLGLSIQKCCCIIAEFVFTCCLVAICAYAAVVTLLGLIWFQKLGYVGWVAIQFLPGWLVGITLGMIIGIIINRIIANKIEPKYSKLIDAKLNKNNTDKFSDIREVYKLIAQTRDFIPADYFNPEKGIFIGREEDNNPIYINSDQFFATHLQIMGCTGSGKGVAGACIVSQLIMRGISTIVFDSKRDGDEWAPHVLKTIAKKANKQFIIINLQADIPQLNLLKDITKDELNELLQGGMGIQDIGGDSDYYRRKDRKAAMAASQLANKAESISHLEVLAHQMFPEKMEQAESFSDQLEILAQIKAIQTTTGVDLKKAITNGDCIYIIGTDNKPEIQLLQKMILLRIKQLIERRNRLEDHRHVTVAVNELKCFLTRPVLLSLAMIRDHGCNFILDHQSPGDLYDVSKDMNGKATSEGVENNTNIKLIYKLNKAGDQENAAKLTGEKVVIRESKEVITNVGMGKVVDTDKKHITTAKEPLYSANVFKALTPRVGVLIGAGLAKLCFTAPIKVTKAELKFKPYPHCRNYKANSEDLTDDF